jgi:hypothetical protein
VYPTLSQDGAAGPVSPFATTVQTINGFVDNIAANPLQYVGLAPTLAALYQINVTIPTTAPSGDQVYEIDGPDSAASQALIPVGGTLSASDRTAHGEEAKQVTNPARLPGPRNDTLKKPVPVLTRAEGR